MTPAGWLAALGASLLLVASIVVVASNWASIDASFRFAGLVAALVAVYYAAEAGRRRSPTTATALATLAATLTAPVGVAAASTLEQPWPVCVLIGGTAALAATELQSRRWDVPALQAATIVAFGLAAVGLSALTAIPIALLGAGGAVGALVLGASRRSVVLGVAVGATPLLVALSDAGIGTGTLARLHATGPALNWVAPLSCIVAAVVIGIVAERRQVLPLAVGAVAVFASGVLTGLAGADIGPAAWWSILPAVLLIVEAAGAATAATVWRDLARRTAASLAPTIGIIAMVLPYGALIARREAETPIDGIWYLPFVLTAAAMTAATVGSARRDGHEHAPSFTLVAASAASFSALVLTPLPLAVVAVVALVGWAGASWGVPWRSWDVMTATFAPWILLPVAMSSAPDTFRLTMVIATGLTLVLSVSTAARSDAGTRLIAVAAVIATCAPIMVDHDQLATGMLTFIGLIGVGSALRPERSTWPLAAAGLMTWQATAPMSHGRLDPVLVIALAVAVGVSTRDVRSVRAHVAVALAVVGVGWASGMSGIDDVTNALAALVIGVVLTGLATVDTRCVALQTGGVVASVMAVGAAASADPGLTSLALAVLGLQAAFAGLVWWGPAHAVPGTALTVVATISLWWTTGVNELAIEMIAPYGATGADLVIAAVFGVLLVAGYVVRRHVGVSSWSAYGPGLGIAVVWLFSTQLEPKTDWATIAALMIGIIAVVVGGVRRLGAPLVIGTVMAGGTIVISAGSRLATAPTWTWIALGGVGLLTAAALVERSERPLLPIGRKADSVPSWLEQFCAEFD